MKRPASAAAQYRIGWQRAKGAKRMLCEECGRQEAQVVLTTVVNGVSSTRHLCRDCVKKYQP